MGWRTPSLKRQPEGAVEAPAIRGTTGRGTRPRRRLCRAASMAFCGIKRGAATDSCRPTYGRNGRDACLVVIAAKSAIMRHMADYPPDPVTSIAIVCREDHSSSPASTNLRLHTTASHRICSPVRRTGAQRAAETAWSLTTSLGWHGVSIYLVSFPPDCAIFRSPDHFTHRRSPAW